MLFVVLRTRKIIVSLNKVRPTFEIKYIPNRERNMVAFDLSHNLIALNCSLPQCTFICDECLLYAMKHSWGIKLL